MSQAIDFPYDMGNAGDLLKHGVLAELVTWQCELDMRFRFMDPFGGEPHGPPVPEVSRRVRALTSGALRTAQVDIEKGRYFGSGLLVRHAARAAGGGAVRVLSGDVSSDRRRRLRECELEMLHEEFPPQSAEADRGVQNGHDGYKLLDTIATGVQAGDIVLIDPFFDDFVQCRASAVVPRIADIATRGAVLLFVLNPSPMDVAGRRFDALLGEHLRGAWRMTCPPLRATSVRGESKYHAEAVLAARQLTERRATDSTGLLWNRVAAFTRQLADVLGLPRDRLTPRLVGH